MSTTSSNSLNSLLKMADALTGVKVLEVSRVLLSAANVIDKEIALRNLLTDGGRSPSARSKLATELFGAELPKEALAILGQAVESRWAFASELVDALEKAGYRAMFALAESESVLDRVEDEIFKFARVVAQNGQLQMALTNPAQSSTAKAGLVKNLLGNNAHPYTLEVLSHVASNLRGRRTDRVFEEVADLAAARRERLRAKLRVAIGLDDTQRTRLSNALTKIYNKPIHLDEVIDTTVMGGIEVRIADDVIDGTIAGRLRQARHRVAG